MELRDHRPCGDSAAAVLVLTFAIASTASAQGPPTAVSDVFDAARQVAGLIDRLADIGSIDENRLGRAWNALNEAESRLPPEIKNRAAGSGPPRGYIGCHVMLANAANDARLRQAQRTHASTQAAIGCYVKELGSLGPVTQTPGTSLAPADLAPYHMAEISRRIVAQHRSQQAQYVPQQPAPPPNSMRCYRLQPGKYQAYTRGYDGEQLTPTRQGIIAAGRGGYELRTRDGIYWLAQSRLFPDGAEYVVPRFKRGPGSNWQQGNWGRIRFVERVSGALEYDVYFSTPQGLLSEVWLLQG